jgi:hypothetical protein
MKLYNDQRNAQVLNVFIDLLLPYVFWAFFSPSLEAGVQFQQLFKSPGYGVSARALNHTQETLVIIQFHFKMHGPYNIKIRNVSTYK